MTIDIQVKKSRMIRNRITRLLDYERITSRILFHWTSRIFYFIEIYESCVMNRVVLSCRIIRLSVVNFLFCRGLGEPRIQSKWSCPFTFLSNNYYSSNMVWAMNSVSAFITLLFHRIKSDRNRHPVFPWKNFRMIQNQITRLLYYEWITNSTRFDWDCYLSIFNLFST